jgi:hypothetical protein
MIIKDKVCALLGPRSSSREASRCFLDPSTHTFGYEGVHDSSSGRLLLDERDEWLAVTLGTTGTPSRRAETSMKVLDPADPIVESLSGVLILQIQEIAFYKSTKNRPSAFIALEVSFCTCRTLHPWRLVPMSPHTAILSIPECWMIEEG